MFANELLKDKLCLAQENQEQSVEQKPYQDGEEADFTFDCYIQKVNNTHESANLQPSSQTVYNNSHTNSQTEQQQQRNDESSQLQMLKTHILTIQSIALKQIQGLKKQLQQEVKQKEMLQQQLQKIKMDYESEEKRLENVQMVNLLKEENNMLKSALKKQLQINRNLIKNSIAAQTIHNHRQNNTHQHTKLQQNQHQNNQQNDPLSINSIKDCNNDSKEKSSLFTIDRPSIPLPGQTKKPLRV